MIVYNEQALENDNPVLIHYLNLQKVEKWDIWNKNEFSPHIAREQLK